MTKAEFKTLFRRYRYALAGAHRCANAGDQDLAETLWTDAQWFASCWPLCVLLRQPDHHKRSAKK